MNVLSCKLISVLLAALLAAPLSWATPPVPEGTRMRVMDAGLGTRDWLEGRLKAGADSCMMVFLDRPSASGHTAVSVAGARQVQMFQSGQWVPAPVGAINAAQPRECRGGGDNG
ncbi:hypothetical protein HLB44_35040 [Aquincola sp. S2]|uniref:DUF2511 domain-containing protein n=2 Tax=Pseudaquabacterium terrae TaxID=2732868 RepID=A0ABX2EU89_9BURK|nr:hypothetical protein [Aquabacterium terrae]